MEREEGVVIEVKGDLAKIMAGKHTECKSCGACPGNSAAIITARNPLGAEPGQRLVFEMSESNALKGAFVIFVLPLIGLFLGVLIGGYIANATGGSILTYKVLGAIIAFILVAVFIKIFDNYIGKKEKSLPVIVKIL